MSGLPGEDYRFWCDLPGGGCGASVTYRHATGSWVVQDAHAPHYKDDRITAEDRERILRELRAWIEQRQGMVTPAIPMPEPKDYLPPRRRQLE